MADDPEAVARDVAARLQQGWNDGSGDAFAAPLTDDADFVDLRAVHHRGRIPIARGHQGIFDSIYRGSRIAYTVTDARQLAPDVILAHTTARLSVPGGPLAGEHAATQTLVIVREGDAWKVAGFHNTVAPPEGRNPLSGG